ncbi:MAG: FRG domain-containing protein [Chloroflexi bacterium]|nr:FRG domain-containing protein [Chloroflexota bacterium]
MNANYTVRTSRTVKSFLDYLLPSASHWKSAIRGDLAYRGQASSSWSLVPKAFRRDVVVGYGLGAKTGGLDRVLPQAQSEFEAVHEFVKAADGAGLQITETGGRLLLQEDPRHIFSDPDWEYAWPQEEVLETLALAQHHGVPTRLLDFTEDPLMAAFFAASEAWDPKEGKPREGSDRKYLAVWVVDLRFLRAISSIRNRYPERIREVRVPRANNSYLHAQLGFFLVDRGANDIIARREPLSLESAIAQRAEFWHYGDRLRGNGIRRQTWFDELPIKKVRISTDQTGELLRELENRGVSRGTLMPSLDRVVESLEFQRTFPYTAVTET